MAARDVDFAAAEPIALEAALDMLANAGLDREGLLRVAWLGVDQAWLYRHDPKLTLRAGNCLTLAWAALTVLVLDVQPDPKAPDEIDLGAGEVVPLRVALRRAA